MGGLVLKIDKFINQKAGVQVSITEQGGPTSMGLRRKDSYKEIIQRSKWSAGEQSLTSMAFSEGEKGPLSRCLVGRFQGCVEITIKSVVRSWAEKAWMGSTICRFMT